MSKKILITGAAGFIGFHLAQYLKKRGDEIIGLDNFNDYYSKQLKKDRASQLEKQGIKIINNDICDKGKLFGLCREQQFTHIAHLAAQPGVRYSITHPEKYIKNNLEGFGNILEACRLNQPITLVYASSSSVYGTNKKIPFSESDVTDSPANLYGATKKANELMAYAYHSLYGIPVTGLRFFTVYGPWGRPDMAPFKFTKAIFEGSAIDVYNNGNMARDFTYVDDIVAGIVASLDLGAPCEVFNLGNNNKEELNHLIEIIEKESGKKAIKNFMPMQLGDIHETYADINHSKEKLGYEPKTSLAEGMASFVRWFKEYYRQP